MEWIEKKLHYHSNIVLEKGKIVRIMTRFGLDKRIKMNGNRILHVDFLFLYI
jgi:hypothetical protein